MSNSNHNTTPQGRGDELFPFSISRRGENVWRIFDGNQERLVNADPEAFDFNTKLLTVVWELRGREKDAADVGNVKQAAAWLAAGTEWLTAEILEKIKAAREPLLQELQRRAIRAATVRERQTEPTAKGWHIDKQGRLILNTGEVYAPTTTGGWVLVKHPTKRMREPGTVEVTP